MAKHAATPHRALIHRPWLIGAAGFIGLVVLVTVLSKLGLSQFDAQDLFAAAAHRLTALRHLAEAQRSVAVIMYVAIYIGLVSVSVPGAMWLSVLGGFLFGWKEGFLYALCAATVGGTFAFLLGRSIFKHWIKTKTGPHLATIKAGFKKNAFNYLLFLRLMPGCPFVVVNLAAAALSIGVPTFIFATLIGILPGTAAQVLTGAGLRQVAALDRLTMDDIALNPMIMAGLAAAAAICVLPVAYRVYQKRARK